MNDYFDKVSSDEHDPVGAEDLAVQAFSRCKNWPQDRAGQLGLAQGLKTASTRFNIPMEEIIQKCRETSAFCPTDFDVLNIAREISENRQREIESKRNLEAEWRQQYGEPQKIDLSSVFPKSGERRVDKLWRELKLKLGINNGQWPSYKELAPHARELGYEDFADAWEKN